MAHLLPHLKEFIVPSTLEDARTILSQLPETSMILGGGISLGMIPRKRLTHVLSISGLGLDYIEWHGDELRIGAATTLGRLEDTLADEECSGIRTILDAVRKTATTPLRNRITVGGIIAGVGPWSDLPVALLTQDTSVIFDATRTVSLESVMQHGPRISAGTGSILSEIRVKIQRQSHGTFCKVGRNATDLAISSAAVCHRPAEDILIAAVGGIVSRPVNLFRIATAEIDHSSESVHIPGLHEMITRLILRRDHRAPDEYRIHLTECLIRDCVGQIHGEGG